MSNHQKRLSAPVSWPVERKTATFTVKAQGPHGDDGVPLVVLLRDVLGYVDSAKEASYAVNTGGVLVNGETVADPRRPIGMFDILTFPDRSEYYRVFPDEGGRLGLTPIDSDAADSRLGKVVDKRVVDGGRVQLNLHDGTNLLVDDHEVASGDSVVVDNEDKAIVAHFSYEEGALVTAVDGQHAGEIGVLAAIEVTPGSSPNTVRVERVASSTQREGGEAAEPDGEFETVEEYVVVIDEKFVGDEPTPGEDAEVEESAVEPDDAEESEEADAEEAEDADSEEDIEEADSEEEEADFDDEDTDPEDEEVESEAESDDDADDGDEAGTEETEEADSGADETEAGDETEADDESDSDDGGDD